jgi:hypothetical protein
MQVTTAAGKKDKEPDCEFEPIVKCEELDAESDDFMESIEISSFELELNIMDIISTFKE